MKVESYEKPQPPPPPLKEVVIRLSEEEANLLFTLLAYFSTAAECDVEIIERETAARKRLNESIGSPMMDHLVTAGAKMVYGLNT